MSDATLPLPDESGGGRFPGFDVMDQSKHWDDATLAVIGSRLHDLPHVRFFTPAEEATAKAVLDQLVGQQAAPGEPNIDLVRMVDRRLAEDETDGWHYDTMPPDEQAWRDTLKALDEDAVAESGSMFAESSWDNQHALLSSVQGGEGDEWHGMPRKAVWSLWTRYAATAFYSHPAAWNEIGFSGPAYPRGYKNIGVDKLEGYEVRDAHPQDNPVSGGHTSGSNS
ncbi:hypothetical protein AX769_21170 (plasmid) [Frondihabitans sp. PAMC 28766]|uniref:gluconate 2-dehydrogenase subunit 3 family protein n=1 Tax=Frondihabitans sp. PAMC 28766 TaxID=1795630 RepID=UPI00078D2810|nr:gluconate 2-dehydrogenase subunit 3 family protein [Frondihabitans sp. PAMC 28766]AMM22650.1 hypothetical protein AX769_21170 [Frondihabitans sp. PAMC 28766]